MLWSVCALDGYMFTPGFLYGGHVSLPRPHSLMATERSTLRSGGGSTLSSPRRGPSEENDIVRLLAQKQDFERRIAERDERNNELQKRLSRAETRARE